MSEIENKKRSEMPEETKWNLADIFADEAAWEKEFAELEAKIPAIEALKDTMLNSAKDLLFAMDEIDKAILSLERLYVYSKMGRDQDNAETSYQSLFAKACNLEVKLSSATSWLEPLLLSASKETIEKYIAEEKGLEVYRFNLEDTLRNKEHILSQSEEKLLSMVGDFSGGAQNIFIMLDNADMDFGKVTASNGEEIPLSHGRYLTEMRHADRETREKVYNRYYEEYKKFRNTLAATYDTSVKKDIFYAKARGFNSARESALFADNVPEAVYDNLINSIHKALPTMHKYMQIRKERLGLDEMQMYDIYTPLVPDVKERYSYEKSQEIVLKGIAPLGEDYLDVVRSAFKSRWIDVYENVGKTSGAYSWGVYGVHPYMLLNHHNDLENMYTLAHEMGHSMHTYYSNKSQPHATAEYKIFVAEIASTVNEILLTKYLLRTTEDKKLRAYILNHYIDQFRTTVLRQTMFAEFEMKAHNMAENGIPLTSESLCKVYGDLNAMYHGDAMAKDDTICYEWSRIPHFYRPFYVYKYATGFSCAAAIVRSIEKNGAEAYRKFLCSGGSDYPLELIKIAGINFDTVVDECMAEFKEAVDEFEVAIKEI